VRVALAILLLASSVASADSTLYDKGIQKNIPEDYPSKSELSAHFGFQLGFGGKLGDASGAKLTGEYAYRFQQYVWFDVQATQLFGFGARTDPCASSTGTSTSLCYRGGWSSGLDVGVKLKIPTKIPVVVEIPVLLGINGMYLRECGDDGVAVPTIRTGAGVKYFIKRWVGVGANIDFDLGPAFHQAGACHKSYTDFYGTFDFNVGAEFIL
jgi:hypothetical protein